VGVGRTFNRAGRSAIRYVDCGSYSFFLRGGGDNRRELCVFAFPIRHRGQGEDRRGFGRLARFAGAIPVTPAHLTASIVNAIEFVGVLFKEVRDVEEAVAFETKVYKRGLHPGQHSRDSPFVNAAGQRILVGPLKKHLDQLPVFENGNFGLVAVLADHQFLGRHELPPLR
jgi:hypothetical protein